MGAIPAHPGPILVPSVLTKIGPKRDFLATSDEFRREKMFEIAFEVAFEIAFEIAGAKL